MTEELREACKRALHVIKTDGEILSGGRASMFILQTLGIGYGLPRLLSLPPFVWFTELSYFIVARNRSFFSRFLFTEKQIDEK